MSRVKGGTVTRRRHKKVLRLTKGFRGNRNRLFRRAKEAAFHSGQNAYAHRRLKKRTFRYLWTVRINAAARAQGLNYSRFISGLFKKKILIDRKNLAEIAYHYPEAFKHLIGAIRS